MHRLVILLALAALAACGGERSGQTSGDTAVTDTVFSREVALERFRAGLAPVESLAPVAQSRDDLVGRFMRAVETSDSAALGELLLSRAEFAWLFYPTSHQGLPPYDVTPDLMWDLLSRQSDRGIGYLLRTIGGRETGYLDYACPEAPAVEGGNRVWGDCTIRRAHSPGDTVAARLTGPILERDRRFKFVSYTNEVD